MTIADDLETMRVTFPEYLVGAGGDFVYSDSEWYIPMLMSYWDQTEALVARMLPRWISEVGEPSLVFDRWGDFLGLGPGDEIGQPGRIFIDVEDFR